MQTDPPSQSIIQWYSTTEPRILPRQKPP
jgi:hypothetical protein